MSIESSNHPVPLMTLSDLVRKEMPGVRLRESPFGDIELVLYLSSRSSGTIAANQEMAEWLMKELIERLRLEAIYQLGLEPQLNAWRDQVNTYRVENSDLRAQVVQLLTTRDILRTRVEDLEATISGENDAEVGDE